MTLAISYDKMQGHGAKKTAKGWEYNRIAIVTGLDVAGFEKLAQAVDAIEDDGFTIGSAHPGYDKLTLQEFQPMPMDPKTARVVMIYRQIGPTATLISSSSSLEQFTTSERLNDLGPLVVEYDGKKQSGTVSTTRAIHTRTYQRIEAHDPTDNGREFANSVNSTVWEMDPEAALLTWRCDGIQGNSNDSGNTWTVTYSFSHNPDTFGQRIYYIDPETGRPPFDLISGTGIVGYKLNQEKDFNELNLSGD